MNSYDQFFAQKLNERLQEARAASFEAMEARLPEKDYQYRCGQLRAYAEVVEMMKEIRKELNATV